MAKEIAQYDASYTVFLVQPDIHDLEMAIPESKEIGPNLILELSEPGKSLIVVFSYEHSLIETRVENVSGEKVTPGTTTLLYARAYSLMKHMADFTNQTWQYQFATKNEQMKAWGLDSTRGRAIFDWDEIEENSESSLFAYKIIKPSSLILPEH